MDRLTLVIAVSDVLLGDVYGSGDKRKTIIQSTVNRGVYVYDYLNLIRSTYNE